MESTASIVLIGALLRRSRFAVVPLKPQRWHNPRGFSRYGLDASMNRKATGAEPARLSGTQSIERALILMREIAAHNRTGTRLLDLASRTGLQRPTVHRMLKCLTLENMVLQDPESHRYFLGPMVF